MILSLDISKPANEACYNKHPPLQNGFHSRIMHSGYCSILKPRLRVHMISGLENCRKWIRLVSGPILKRDDVHAWDGLGSWLARLSSDSCWYACVLHAYMQCYVFRMHDIGCNLSVVGPEIWYDPCLALVGEEEHRSNLAHSFNLLYRSHRMILHLNRKIKTRLRE